MVQQRQHVGRGGHPNATDVLTVLGYTTDDAGVLWYFGTDYRTKAGFYVIANQMTAVDEETARALMAQIDANQPTEPEQPGSRNSQEQPEQPGSQNSRSSRAAGAAGQPGSRAAGTAGAARAAGTARNSRSSRNSRAARAARQQAADGGLCRHEQPEGQQDQQPARRAEYKCESHQTYQNDELVIVNNACRMTTSGMM